MRSTVFAVIALLTACTRADVLRVDPSPRPVPVSRTVPVLLDEPSRPYRSIALIEVAGSWGASLDRMGRRLAAEAAKLGGDAVLVTRRTAHSESALVPVGDSFVVLDREDSRLVGKVIVFDPPAASVDNVAAFDPSPPR
jgi:hypothetical protein